MFLQPTKKGTPPDAKPLNTLTAVLSAEQLLSDPKRQEKIALITGTSQLAKEKINSLCLGLINQVAYYYQRLPGNTSYYALPGGLLDYALARTQAAMQLFRQYSLPDTNEILSDDQHRWWYALFSASLLRGVGTLSLDYRVERYSIKGQFIKIWEPLIEPIGHHNHYFFEFKTTNDRDLRYRLTLLLARQLIPEDGFAWIASNQEVLSIWLALLDEDQTATGILGAILDRADAIAIQDDLQQIPLRATIPTRDKPARIGTFVDNSPESLATKERLVGVEFMRWLSQQLENGKFILNRAPIWYVPGGLLICIEAMQAFMKEHEYYKNWQTIQQGILSLKLHTTGEHGTAVTRHEKGNGILLAGSVALPENLFIQSTTTKEAFKTTATAFALSEFPQRLTQNGTWSMINQESHSLTQKPTSSHG